MFKKCYKGQSRSLKCRHRNDGNSRNSTEIRTFKVEDNDNADLLNLRIAAPLLRCRGGKWEWL